MRRPLRQAVEEVLAAYEIGDVPPAVHPLVLDVLP